jgi:hypothetical protein
MRSSNPAPDVGVFGQQERLQPFLAFHHGCLCLFDFLSHNFPVVARGLGQHFTSRRHVSSRSNQLVPDADNLSQFLVAPRQITDAIRIGQDRWIA